MPSIAVVGAAGLVGGEILELLGSRQLETGPPRLLGSLRTAGGSVEVSGRPSPVELLSPQAFEGIEVAFFAAGPAVSGEYVPAAVAAGATVIDLTSRFRLDPEVPLVVPEVNSTAIGEHRTRGIIAAPSATSTGLAVVLGPLAAAAGLRRVVVSTYQGVASAGRRMLGRLSRDTIELLNARGGRRAGRSLAFDCIPQVGALEPGGLTAHELHVVEETRRVLGIPDLALSVTAVRVPVFFGLALSLAVETEQRLGAAAARELLRDAPGILVQDEDADPYPTPATVAGSDATHVGRIRDDPAAEHGLALWVALDSVRKGAALNAVQIAEILTRDYL
jgi:aspartate-semialdehyde dehydrogenase